MKHILTALFILLMQAPLAHSQEPAGLSVDPALALPPEDSLEVMQDEFLPVEEAYQLALEVTDAQHLRLYWQIEEGYYLYKKRFAFTLQTADGEIELTPTFPDGVIREDEYFGKSEVFYHSADISLALASPGERGTLKVTSQGCADAGLCYPPERQQFRVDFLEKSIAPAEQESGTGAAVERRTDAQPFSASGLLYMMLLAFIGGSILNLMPCVFPVLSLKVFSFATGSEHSKHVHGWVYAFGVVASFLLVASVLITLQRAGAAVGWGFQLQEPRFVALLAYLFFVMGLSLSGLIELGAGFMGLGSQLAERGGYSGSFFTGVLATVVASPCTAPFMGTALGFAVTQPAPVALAVFAALGSGMAAPMLLLSYSKTLRSRMPKPGPWMETFKQLLAFPLYATAIWLLWVAGRQTSVTAMAILLCGMLALALGLWLWRYRPWGRVAGGLALLAAVMLIPSSALKPGATETAADGGWSEQRLAALVDGGTPVFVNVTADWCITCIANERSTLSNDEVEAAMAAMQMEYIVVDWTDYNANIAAFLAQFGRNGVPLYLVYSGQPGAEPEVLPQLLTPGIVLGALGRAEAPAVAER
jgi:thiol:disulfide interchange protein DsbD